MLTKEGEVNYRNIHRNIIVGNQPTDIWDFSYGFSGTYKLPWNLTIDTDLSMNSHRGYADTEMNDNTILGIESVEIDSDDNTLFAFSFDGGSTWKAYTDGRWMTLSEETSGMNRESVKAVGTDAWNEAAADRQYKIRFALREGGYVNRITVHYLN